MEVTVTAKIPASADRTWRLIEKFGEISWVPPIAHLDIQVDGAGPGMRRIIPGENAPCIERLDEIDPGLMRMKYSIVSGNPMPIENLSVEAIVKSVTSETSEITWTCQASGYAVSDEIASNMLTQFYQSLAKWIADALASDHG